MREKIKEYLDSGLTVAQAASRSGSSKQYAYQILRGDVSDHRAKLGHPRKSNPKIRCNIKRFALSSKNYSLRRMGVKMKKIGFPVSPSTIKQILIEAGFKAYSMQKRPYRTRKAVEKRISFSRHHIHDNFSNIIYSDETSVELLVKPVANKRNKAFRHSWSEVPKVPTQAHPCRIQIWSAISSKYHFPLVILPKALDSELYKHILKKHILRIAPKGGKAVFQQDNAQPHKAKIIVYLLNKEARWINDWPPYSPDLNPIENVWNMLKEEFQGHEISSKKNAINVLSKIWNSKSFRRKVENALDSAENRVALCLKNKGGDTRYWENQ